MSTITIVKWVAYCAAGLVVAVPVAVVSLIRRVTHSVGVAPPTEKQLQEEKPLQDCPLIRHFPKLQRTLAWRSLGVTEKSPIHKLVLPALGSSNGQEQQQQQQPLLTVYVKREDLLSPLYGGNKVRTLQHQLAVCEARRDRGETAFEQLVSLGSGGSNQVVAATVHARALGWTGPNTTIQGDDHVGNAIHPCWFDKDEPDLDNTLNMLSVLSMPNVGRQYSWNWGAGISSPWKLLAALKGAWKQEQFVPMMMGGNCPTGVLGQVGAMLELAEQIDAGDCPDPQRLYIPIGSACTISGLVVGCALARTHTSLKAFQDASFTIVGCNVHHGFAMADAKTGFHTNPKWGFMPLSMTYTIRHACAALHQVGGPDVTHEALEFMKHHVELKHNAEVVGMYGGHSELTRQAAQWHDEHGKVQDVKTGQPVKPLWICGHFVAKALQPLIVDLGKAMEQNNSSAMQPCYLLWMTKSAVQPLGTQDEWSQLQAENEAVLAWANKGIAESPKYRPGKVSTKDGSAKDYRAIMTKIIE